MKKITLSIFILLFGLVLFSHQTLAQSATDDSFGFNQQLSNIATNAGYNPANQDETTLEKTISTVINVVLSLVGVLFMILMIYGGLMWMTAGGDDKKVEKAQDTIRAGIIGLVIVIAAYAISIFVISKLWGTTAGPTV